MNDDTENLTRAWNIKV